ncbi:MAG: TRAP transporter large permease subunit, partial [Serpentinimonas sp.]|nr:TRAP transporter large permease subunit [Serpentinimonas sp.]
IVVPLLLPVAQMLDINLVWFGVILAMNLQTSFLTPPFGFSLFYLRSVAPRNDYLDAITKKRIAGVTTEQIYKGSIVFVLMQVTMVGLLIAYPTLVTGQIERVELADEAEVQRRLQQIPGFHGGDPSTQVPGQEQGQGQGQWGGGGMWDEPAPADGAPAEAAPADGGAAPSAPLPGAGAPDGAGGGGGGPAAPAPAR